MSMLEEYVRDLAELVNRDCGTTNCAGVTSAAEVMKRHFESIGWEAELVDLGPTAGRGLICRNKPGSTECDVIFNAHLDTVFPDGTAAARPFSIEGTTAHGPGCSDCKSGVLAIFYACRNARPEDLERLSVWCVFNPDEELGSRASKEWLRELSTHAKAALVFEAARAGGELVRSRKGSSNIRFTFKGLTAHAGNNPQDGRNANVAAMRLALAAYELDDKTRGTTVNPGLIHGGTGANIISDHAEVTLDLRFWNDEDGREIVLEFVDALEYNGQQYQAFFPAETEGADEDPDNGLVILKVLHEDGEDLLSTLDSDEELDAVYDLFMESLFDEDGES